MNSFEDKNNYLQISKIKKIVSYKLYYKLWDELFNDFQFNWGEKILTMIWLRVNGSI